AFGNLAVQDEWACTAVSGRGLHPKVPGEFSARDVAKVADGASSCVLGEFSAGDIAKVAEAAGCLKAVACLRRWRKLVLGEFSAGDIAKVAEAAGCLKAVACLQAQCDKPLYLRGLSSLRVTGVLLDALLLRLSKERALQKELAGSSALPGLFVGLGRMRAAGEGAAADGPRLTLSRACASDDSLSKLPSKDLAHLLWGAGASGLPATDLAHLLWGAGASGLPAKDLAHLLWGAGASGLQAKDLAHVLWGAGASGVPIDEEARSRVAGVLHSKRRELHPHDAVLALWGMAASGGILDKASNAKEGGGGEAWWGEAKGAVAKVLRRGVAQLTAHDIAHAVTLLRLSAPGSEPRKRKDDKKSKEDKGAAVKSAIEALAQRATLPQFGRAWERLGAKWGVNVRDLCTAAQEPGKEGGGVEQAIACLLKLGAVIDRPSPSTLCSRLYLRR
ncbi:hypothetical protein T484DRAFT_1793579, partial [Baffinella frigidus]